MVPPVPTTLTAHGSAPPVIATVYAPLAAVVVAPVPVPHFTLTAAPPSAAPCTAVPAIVTEGGGGAGAGAGGGAVSSPSHRNLQA